MALQMDTAFLYPFDETNKMYPPAKWHPVSKTNILSDDNIISAKLLSFFLSYAKLNTRNAAWRKHNLKYAICL